MPRFETADGSVLNYRLQGRGSPALILIHGWCGNLHHWDATARHFARRHRVLRMDRRGRGRSSVSASGYSAKLHADDIAALARKERIRRAVVIGQGGNGCPVALELARSHPGLVKAVALVDAPINPRVTPGDANSPLGSMLGQMIETLEQRGKRGFTEIYRTYFHPASNRAAVREAIAAASETPMEVAIAELQSIAAGSDEIARGVSQPALWIMADACHEEQIRSIVPQAQFGQLVGCGHFPNIEQPAQLNAMLETFVAQL